MVPISAAAAAGEDWPDDHLHKEAGDYCLTRTKYHLHKEAGDYCSTRAKYHLHKEAGDYCLTRTKYHLHKEAGDYCSTRAKYHLHKEAKYCLVGCYQQGSRNGQSLQCGLNPICYICIHF